MEQIYLRPLPLKERKLEQHHDHLAKTSSKLFFFIHLLCNAENGTPTLDTAPPLVQCRITQPPLPAQMSVQSSCSAACGSVTVTDMSSIEVAEFVWSDMRLSEGFMMVKCCWLILSEMLGRQPKSSTRFRRTNSVLELLLFPTKVSHDPQMKKNNKNKLTEDFEYNKPPDIDDTGARFT